MRFICLVALLATPAFGQGKTVSPEFEAAGLQLVISNMCRANLGDEEVFEEAFQNFRNVGLRQGSLTRREARETRQMMLQAEPKLSDNMFQDGMCADLRRQFGLPQKVD